jgi:hypothetical protein
LVLAVQAQVQGQTLLEHQEAIHLLQVLHQLVAVAVVSNQQTVCLVDLAVVVETVFLLVVQQFLLLRVSLVVMVQVESFKVVAVVVVHQQ